MKSLLCSLVVVCCLAGCATSPVPAGMAPHVPASRMLAPQWSQPGTGTGALTVKRDTGFAGSGCTIRLFVNATPAADIESAEKVDLFLPLGDHVISITPRGALCPSTIVETGVTVVPDRVKLLRIGTAASMDLVLQPTAF